MQSRYYDPVIGRFINADAFASTDQGILGSNMFSYCLNNPTNLQDSSGTLSLSLSDSGAFSESSWRWILEKCRGTINGQRREPYAKMRYGLSTVGAAGCEAIACYNTLILLGRGEYFNSIVDFFVEEITEEPLLGFFGFAKLGAHPFVIGDFLESRGIKCTPFKDRTYLNSNTQSGIYIITFWNEDPPMNGCHTVAIKYDNSGKYTIYNYGSYDIGPNSDLSSMRSIQESFIYGYFIPFGQ